MNVRIRPRLCAIGLCLLCLSLAHPSPAQLGEADATENSPDSRLKVALDELGFKYEVTENNNFSLVFQTHNAEETAGEDMRTQAVYISSRTVQYRNFEVRTVFSPVFASTEPIRGEILRELLTTNESMKIGYFSVYEAEDKDVVFFNANLAAAASAESIKSMIIAVYQTADDWERKLAGEETDTF